MGPTMFRAILSLCVAVLSVLAPMRKHPLPRPLALMSSNLRCARVLQSTVQSVLVVLVMCTWPTSMVRAANAEFALRLSEVSVAVESTVRSAGDPDGRVVVWMKPAERWCTTFLRDLLALNNINEFTPSNSVRPVMSQGNQGAAEDPLLPPFDQEYRVEWINGTKLVVGYIAVTWEGKSLLMRVHGMCLAGSPREEAECKGSIHFLQVFQWPQPEAQELRNYCDLNVMSAGALDHWRKDVVVVPMESVVMPSR